MLLWRSCEFCSVLTSETLSETELRGSSVSVGVGLCAEGCLTHLPKPKARTSSGTKFNRVHLILPPNIKSPCALTTRVLFQG